jgi:hypothetical protein
MITIMKNGCFMLAAFLLLGSGLQAQGIGQKAEGNPNTKVRVNKQYDEKGNLIRYDSSYVFSYRGEGHALMADSVLKSLQQPIDDFYSFKPFMFRQDIWPNDSLSLRHFQLFPPFESEEAKSVFEHMQEMMRRFDALRQSFLEEMWKWWPEDPAENRPKGSSQQQGKLF